MDNGQLIMDNEEWTGNIKNGYLLTTDSAAHYPLSILNYPLNN